MMKKIIDKILYRIYRNAARKYCIIQKNKLYSYESTTSKECRLRRYKLANSFVDVLNKIDLEQAEERIDKFNPKN